MDFQFLKYAPGLVAALPRVGCVAAEDGSMGISNLALECGDVWAGCLSLWAEAGRFSESPNVLSLLESLSFLGYENGLLRLGAQNSWMRTMVLANREALEGILRADLHGFVRLEVEVSGPAVSVSKFELPPAKLMKVPAKKKPVVKAPEFSLCEAYTFENFAEGECNREALALCKRIAEEPGECRANPLYLYGASGLGKTHLLQALAHAILASGRPVNVLYCSSINFLEDYVGQYKGPATEKLARERKFRERYESLDVLLIDDIQLLASKASGTQLALLSLIERMRSCGRQVVLASDRHASEFSKVDFKDRLLTRFEESVAVELGAPDSEVRLNLVARQVNAMQVQDSDRGEICRFIATPAVSNFRELQGKLNRLQAEVDLMHRSVTVSLVRDLFAPALSKISIKAIADATALEFALKVEELRSSSRIEKIALARKIAMFICRRDTKEPLTVIGEFFGRKHSTVIAACDSVEKLLAESPDVLRAVSEIRCSLGMGNPTPEE